ncbi:MAG TPA: adenosine deaminase [Acidimicrobiia bacterium]|jgi:adenosine deaminase
MLPSVLLHDHLDGGLRPGTVLELAEACGYDDLPADNEHDLARWFDQKDSGSLEAYLGAFRHTIAVMQGSEALERVAYEAGHDLAADGVVYGEVRFSPPLHAPDPAGQGQVIEAVASGLRMAAEETGMRWGMIIDALRHLHDSQAVARLAMRHRHLGVVGFDIAGPEAGFPPRAHVAAFRMVRAGGLRLTIHAGESAGPHGVAFMAQAMDVCGAERIGHGIEIIRDCRIEDDEIVALGGVARRVRDRRIPLEVCPSSNLATGRLVPDQHPIGLLYRAGFNVTLSTDNRLMSSTSMSEEFDLVRKYHGFEVDDLARVTRRSLEAAFCSWEVKAELWEDAIAPAYTAAGAGLDPVWS